MEAEHEELASNPFFVSLLSKPELVAEIARHSALVCVPSRDSLKLCALTPDFLATHVLIPTGENSELYRTKNGKNVIFNSGKVVCREGFPRPRTVMVVFEETFYDDDFNSIKVLRTNFPLEGKIPLNYYKSVAQQASIDVHTLNARTLPEHQAVLIRLSVPAAAASSFPTFSPEQALANISVSPSPALTVYPSLPPVFASISRFVQSYNAAYVLVKGFVDHAGGKVKEACERIKSELQSANDAGGGGAKMSRVASMEASAAIETCIFAGIHRKLWNGLVELYKHEEQRTQALLASCTTSSMKDLGVREELICEPELAVQHLQQALNGMFAITPLQKLSVLEDTNRLLTQAVDAQLADTRMSGKSEPGEKPDVTLAADDLLQFWLFLVIRAKPSNLHANMVYMHHFQPASTFINTQQLKVHLANLEGAISFIDSGQLGNAAGLAVVTNGTAGSAAPPSGPRRTRSTSTIITNSFANLTVRDSPSTMSGGGNPFARTPAGTSAAAASAASRSRHDQPTLASIADDYEEFKQSMGSSSSSRLAVSTDNSRTTSPQRSMTQTNASSHTRQSSLQFHARSELPATRNKSSNIAPSSAVAAVAAGSVGRVGNFLAGLEDGVTGRLGSAASAQPLAAGQSLSNSSRRATGPIPTSSTRNALLHAAPTPQHGVLRLDDDDLPPLIVERQGSTSNTRTVLPHPIRRY